MGIRCRDYIHWKVLQLNNQPPPTGPKNKPSEKVQANALMFLRRHIDPSLQWEYLQLKTPKELWDALKGIFGNVHDSLLPELMVQWNEIRLLDYKNINDFNKEMLRFKARLNFCGKELTENDMIQKTLSTFPTSEIILINQYRLEYNDKRLTTFNKLINLLQVAERHNEVLLNNNARPVGTKKIPESNHASVRDGKNSKGQRAKHTESYTRGNYTPQGRGRGLGRGQGRNNNRGGFSNSWHINATVGPSNQRKSKGKTPMTDPAKR
ncbi:uncharacterized protein LOC112512907 [Cynara cardunculus var. scolymus]|uniref:uncharacterized protein LOC112512907 n=1 Tax=Cynara cardunculus var. scolymus TaxID=59895 RepID=UPI000D62DB4D|nr:uncharacterized protein LOC112512907 [Cynara cardunculus var. scolymus]